MRLEKRKLEDLTPYENNPRFNDDAVDDVAESIRQCDYNAPIIVDENNVILAGHTRLKALQQLGYDEAEVIVKEGLTEKQKKKYRLLDNQTSSKSEWDYDKLMQELDGMDFEGFDFGFDDADFDSDVYNAIAESDEYKDIIENSTKNTFEIGLCFPIEYKEEITRYVRNNSKDIVNRIVQEAIKYGA